MSARLTQGAAATRDVPIVPLVEPAVSRRSAHAPELGAALDPDSREWLDALRGEGAVRDGAVARLHALLLRAARFETARRRATHPHLRDELDEIAHEAAHDALLAVLDRLDDFRGASRFTTWAYKFALYQASVKVRRRAWQGRELPVEEEALGRLAGTAHGPDSQAEARELLGEIGKGIAERLTPRQRTVLVALALNDVPIDVLAERMETTRGALYKTLHDARRKLRGYLAEAGHPLDGATKEVT
jgi:RNA polymerase sigma-70 factor, ECF subfamily